MKRRDDAAAGDLFAPAGDGGEAAGRPAAPVQLALGMGFNSPDGTRGALRLRSLPVGAAQAMGAVPADFSEWDAVGPRWAHALRRRYPVGDAAAKRIARDFGCSVKTAETWLAGGAPYAKNLVRLGMLFGEGAILDVLVPPVRRAGVEVLAADVRELQAKLAQIGERIVQLEVVS